MLMNKLVLTTASSGMRRRYSRDFLFIFCFFFVGWFVGIFVSFYLIFVFDILVIFIVFVMFEVDLGFSIVFLYVTFMTRSRNRFSFRGTRKFFIVFGFVNFMVMFFGNLCLFSIVLCVWMIVVNLFNVGDSYLSFNLFTFVNTRRRDAFILNEKILYFFVNVLFVSVFLSVLSVIFL